MTPARQFLPAELRDVHRALGEAEDLTGRFYCIPGREWPRYPYDVRTGADGPVPRGPAFADVVRVVATDRDADRRRFAERYRIRLNDEAILGAVHDRDDGVALYPLLLYLLTHELVHVIRFGARHAEFDAGLEERLREERHVHAVTGKVLAPARIDGLRKVTDLYSGAYLEASDPGVFSPK
jgi:hypothetical protein